MQSVNLPSTLTYLGRACFQNNTSLSSPIVIPAGVDTILIYAFYNCSNLESVTLSEGVVAIDTAAFYRCTSLRDIHLPNTLRSVGPHAFQFDYSLDTVIFPDNVHYIGEVAFDECSGLSYCHLPEQLEKVTPWMLYGTNMESLVIPPHVTRIEMQSLAGCQRLHKVTVPASVTYFGDSLFIDGTTLDTLVLLCSEPPTLGVGVFPTYTATLIVPCGSASAYRQHTVWGRFANIEEDCNGIEAVCGEQIAVSVRDGQIVVDGAEGETVSVYDLTGRSIATAIVVAGNDARVPVPETGVYLIKVGNLPAKKVVVIR
jgi:hypothetical protein